VVFIGVGFETTSPTIAAAMKTAFQDGVPNFSVLPSFKLVPPALIALCAAPDARLEGFLCPGHVSTIIGTRPYGPVARAARVPCVIAGFEALDILEGVAELVEQIRDGRHEVVNGYARAVREDGNPAAQACSTRSSRSATRRGAASRDPRTGLQVRDKFATLDARRRFRLPPATPDDLPAGCSCGLVMRGVLVPPSAHCLAPAARPPCRSAVHGLLRRRLRRLPQVRRLKRGGCRPSARGHRPSGLRPSGPDGLTPASVVDSPSAKSGRRATP